MVIDLTIDGLEASLHAQEHIEKLVIQMHGLRGSKNGKHRVNFANHLHSLGYSVLRFSFSVGCYANPFNVPLGRFMKQQLIDSQKVLDYVLKELAPTKIGLIGACTGANVALSLASNLNSCEAVDTVVALAPYGFPEGNAKVHSEEIYLRRARALASTEKRVRAFRNVGIVFDDEALLDIRDLDLTERVRQVSPDLPVLFILGDKDPLVSENMVRPLYDAKPGTKDFQIIKSRSHGYTNPREVRAVNKYTEHWLRTYL